MFLSILISVSFFPILKILSIIVYFDKLRQEFELEFLLFEYSRGSDKISAKRF